MGKILVGALVLCALIAGGAMYYLQVYYYYADVTASTGDIALTPVEGGAPEGISARVAAAIDAESSPIRFRACFTTDLPLSELDARFAPYDEATPLTAPGWFDCFDAAAIGAALDSGAARAFLGTRDVVWGIDRIVAVLPDGRGFAWHQINHCGEVVFDGQPLPEGCPPQPERR